jgi:MraZ protein
MAAVVPSGRAQVVSGCLWTDLRGASVSFFIGSHRNKIDGKGRVSVPKTFRDALQAQGSAFVGIYAYPLCRERAIEGCGEEFKARVVQSVEEVRMNTAEQEALAVAYLENTHQLPFDPEGRVLLPDALRAHAGLDGEALFVGRGGRFQIWNPVDYQQSRGPMLDRLKTETPTLQLLPLAKAPR